ncbi:hypothetical protein [Aureispira sp. CCB-E]|uniref:hypothetical protein n=1 Tax=Aureispira sp. CCB-E TaxID=3051121 RepID=UPI002868E2BE|nr:hypothetical protein [Aureispira sp. CCB-E]WMX13227.1 hypothetical protein QP953_20495 [Aureispira sp. CCB-E]
MENPTNKTPLLVIGLLLILALGGWAVWAVLRPKKEEEPTVTTKKETAASTPAVTGRNNVSSQNTGLTKEQIAFLFGHNNSSFNSGNTGNENQPKQKEPLYIKGTRAQALITAKAEHLQSKVAVMDIIRAKYDIGRELIKFNSDTQKAIDQLFDKVSGVDVHSDPAKRYLTFPIYGKHESQGPALRSDLQKLLDRGWEGLNLSNKRDPTMPWWLPSVQLNLLLGTTVSTTISADNIWWYWGQRSELDFFKDFNGHQVDDRWLVKVNDNGKAAYPAGNLYTFVQRWVEAIDQLNKVTEWEAIRTLTAPTSKGGDGWLFTYLDPETGTDYSKSYDPQDSRTNDALDLILT